jgi:hypothetical protein
MGRRKSAKRELLRALVSTAIGVIGAADLIGHPARTVHVVTIFAGGLSAGISLARAIDRIRAERREARAVAPPAV